MRRKAFSVVATLLWGIALSVSAGSAPAVLNGIDVLRARNFDLLAGKRIGLITNHTGVAADGTRTVDLLFKSKVCQLTAIFSPEHGINGTADDKVNASIDDATSLPIYSLYGEVKRPSPQMLKNVDALVFDIQDIGARFYTYITTMAYCMEEAAKAGIQFYVLDRPNPIGGTIVEGPMLDPDRTSFLGYAPMPVRHGMTVGELALFFNAKIGAKLHVVEMEGWARPYYFWDTGQLWVNPSPNIRNMSGAILYPGVCLLEFTNVSVARGTDRPFEMIGAPWIDPKRLTNEMINKGIPGIRFIPVFFTPVSGKHQGKKCGGVSMLVDNVQELNPVLLGLSLIAGLRKLYTEEFDIAKVMNLLGNAEAMRKLENGKTPFEALRSGSSGMREFMSKRQQSLLYGPSPKRKKERR